MPGRWVGGIAGLELSAGLSEEGQGSGCRPGPTLAGRGWVSGPEWVRWDGIRIERGRLKGSWVPGCGAGPRREVINAGKKIDFCLERTEAEKRFLRYL